MTRLAAAAGATVLAVLCGCQEGPVISPARRPVRDGTPTSGDPGVAALGLRPVACAQVLSPTCSAVLVAPRVLLTAAHCVADARGWAVFLGSDTAAGGDYRGILATRIHPDYDTDPAHDIALVLLDAEAAGVVPMATAPLTAGVVGSSVRIVGFGADGDTGTPGIKRTGTSMVTELTGSRFGTAPMPAMSCAGDSGGPVLADLGAGELVVGLTLSGDLACEQFASNLDVGAYHAEFIAPALLELEGLADPGPRPIGLDELCTAECQGDDDCPVDMVCGAAGQCSLPGVPVGALEGSCAADDECGDGTCVRALLGADCQCAVPCDSGGGCRAASGTPVTALLLLVLLCCLRRWRLLPMPDRPRSRRPR